MYTVLLSVDDLCVCLLRMFHRHPLRPLSLSPFSPGFFFLRASAQRIPPKKVENVPPKSVLLLFSLTDRILAQGHKETKE